MNGEPHFHKVIDACSEVEFMPRLSKPRLSKNSIFGGWFCQSADSYAIGRTPAEAYAEWFRRASILRAYDQDLKHREYGEAVEARRIYDSMRRGAI